MTEWPEFSAVILDLDGLVLDTESTYKLAWRSALEVMGYTFTPVFYQRLSGLQYESIEQVFWEQCGANFDVVLFRKISAEKWYDHVSAEGIAVKPGVFDLLETLIEHQIPYCLATNSLSENAERNLEIAGIGHLFPQKVTRDQVKRGKPAPDIFLLAARVLGCSVEQCLVIEDSVVGLEAAQCAGAVSVWVPEVGANQIEGSLDNIYRCNDLIELKQLLF